MGIKFSAAELGSLKHSEGVKPVTAFVLFLSKPLRAATTPARLAQPGPARARRCTAPCPSPAAAPA